MQSINRDIKFGENIVKNLGMDYLALSIADNLNVGSMINSQQNLILRNLERGALWYVAKEVENEIITGSSNLRTMDVKVAIDDTLFNALASISIETIGPAVNSTIYPMVPNGIDSGRLTNAIILSGIRVVGSTLGINNPLKNLSSYLGF